MVQQSLIEYIQNLLKQGYDISTIRNALLNAGYSPYDVDMAMRVAGATERKVSTKTLIILFIALLAVSGILLVILKTMQAPPAVLSFNVNLFSTQVAPGRDLVINAEILNPSGTKTSGLIDYEVSGPSGRVASKTESFTVVARASVPTSISLPPAAIPGTYSITAKLSYAGKQQQTSRTFDVVEKAEMAVPAEVLKEKKAEEAKAFQLTCPGGCDDLNFCTSDECVQGVCISTTIVPCCGNNRCEEGESKSSCPIDCSEKPISVDELLQKAKEAAAADLGRAEEICDSLVQRVYVDSCLLDVSEASSSKEPCASIVNSDKRDACYIPFAYKNDFTVCAEITNPYMKNSCQSLESMAYINATYG